ncbi:hypothetical protein RHS04_02244 [Rhizoctonia solani]|uniref:Nucleolus and neural progenitor protein-like N-terminal domain-containing protein n=1 Tax=Rhizoctonia solani TaxID=456999 RepID=A0A8H7HAJ1_9AGAM|nr:hypothetical protein RHS04_02244 [Rhizoctonia solani]
MPQRRFRLVASADYKARDNLDIPSVAQLLKQLKAGHKNARNVQKLLFTEMHVLERVYYKGKNQHGLSLFWRSVVSVRRMSTRIYETNVPGLLEVLAGMFHEEPFGGQKVFSGAWTRIPPVSSIAQILERLLDMGTLLQAAIAAFQKAYRAFCLAMSNTAFLQLTIVLIGIVSWASSVASALSDVISTITPCVYAVFQALQPPTSLLTRISKRFKKSQSIPAPDRLPTPPLNHVPEIRAPMYTNDDMDEDLGLSVERNTVPWITPLSPNPVVQAPTPSPPTNLTLSISPPSPDVETTTPLSPPSPSSSPSPPPTPLPSQPPRAQVVPRNIREEPPARAVSAVTTSTKPKKKRKKARDEIDDIFG